MTALAASLFTLAQTPACVLVYPWRSALSIITYIKHEPVRVFALAVIAAVVVVSLLTGVPVGAIVAQVIAYAAAAEKVRDAVSPVAKIVLGKDETPAA